MKKNHALEAASHTLSVEALRELISRHEPPCVSIYLPTRRGGGPDDRQRYDGLLRRARELLADDMKPGEVRDFLEPLENPGDAFWQEQQDGLAVFRARETTLAWALPANVPELVVASDSFHVRPLLRFLQSNQHYYLLSLAQNHVGFFRGDVDGLRGLRVPDLPRSLVDALGQEDRQKTISMHSTGAHGNMPVFHGQGKEESSRDEDVARFLRVVDKALWPILRAEKAPLILAATERYHPSFQAITRYAHVAEEGLHGNFEKSSTEELHRRAWPIVERQLVEREGEICDRYQRLVSSGRALDELRAIAQFTVQGRVDELLLARDARIWGTLDRDTGALRLHGEEQQAHDDDVLDDIAEAVIVRGGSVVSLPQERMPTSAACAAILRW